jgi:hypothetical protein
MGVSADTSRVGTEREVRHPAPVPAWLGDGSTTAPDEDGHAPVPADQSPETAPADAPSTPVNAAIHARLASPSGTDEAGVIPAEDAADALRTIFLSKHLDDGGSESNGSVDRPPSAAAETRVEPRATEPAAIEPVPIERLHVAPADVASTAAVLEPYPTPPQNAAPMGPVLAETEGLLTEDHAYGLDLRRPTPAQHPHIPRPPDEGPAPVPTSRRDRRREKKQRKGAKPEQVDRSSAIVEAQFAQMSAAGRRLYGLEPIPDERERGRLDQVDLARMMQAGAPSDGPDG